jgi:hypothetical protein
MFEVNIERSSCSIKEASVEPLGGSRATLGNSGASRRPGEAAEERSVSALDVDPEDKATSTDASRIPWWLVGTRVTSTGAPVAVGVLHPLLGGAVALIVVFVTLLVIVTALFGSGELSRRAFRLMRLIRNRPEPQNPPGEQ